MDDITCDGTCDELEITHDIFKWCKELQELYDKLKAEIIADILSSGVVSDEETI